MNQRVAVLLCHADAVLLIRRVKEGQEYYVIPGGGVESGEALEDAARREILEELSLTIEVGPVLWQEINQGRMETCAKADRVTGDIALGGPEKEKQSSQNQYHPEWVSFERIQTIDLRPATAKARISDLVRAGQL